jgi:bifunctional non-homologous end joining protein LigD
MPSIQFSFPNSEPYLRFIVHLHQATQLHYDLRLEFGATLFNLVLPKGPSVDPRVRRLAIRTHDHAKSCLTFEGRISPGRYGAGQLLAWDRGLYAPRCPRNISHEEAIRRGLANGALRCTFNGFKLRGDWTLKRFNENWLFIKEKDRFASEKDIRLLDWSVLSGMRLGDL